MALTESISGVEVFRWMPQRFTALPGYQPTNFGDSLAGEIVRALVSRLAPRDTPQRPRRLLSLGSIMHFAQPCDTLWGTGINDKVDERIGSSKLDVRAVRGPKSRAALRKLGVAVPEVYGDPALLLPELFPETVAWTKNKQYEYSIIPNLNDAVEHASMQGFVSPLAPVWEVVRRIAQSEFVVASSLHAIIIAEALGVPVRPFVSGSEARFKYDDYAMGTGRAPLAFADTPQEALGLGPIEPLAFDSAPLLRAFPADLWRTPPHSQLYALQHGAPETLHSALRDLRDDHELVICLASPTDQQLEEIYSSVANRANVRVVAEGTDPSEKPTKGSLLNTAASFSRGKSISSLTDGDSRPPGALSEAIGTLESRAGIDLVFMQTQEFEHGPDKYAISVNESRRELQSLRFMPELVTARPSSIIIAAELLSRCGSRVADRDQWEALELLVCVAQSDLPAAVLGTVGVLHDRRFDRPSTSLADRLQLIARILARPISPEIARELVILATSRTDDWKDANTDAANLQEASRAIMDAISDGPCSAEAMQGIGSIALASIGFVDVAAASLGHWSDLNPSRLVEAADAFAHPSNCAMSAATITITKLVPLAMTRASAPQRSLLREAVGRLPMPEGSAQQPITMITAAREDPLEFALSSSTQGDVIILRASQSPFGWKVEGTISESLADPRIRIWTRNRATSVLKPIGKLRLGSPGSSGKVAFTAFVHSIRAPAGLLEVRMSRTGRAAPVMTSRSDGGKFVHQLLHPVELPLDGGQALLVRRPMPLLTVASRMRQGR